MALSLKASPIKIIYKIMFKTFENLLLKKLVFHRISVIAGLIWFSFLGSIIGPRVIALMCFLGFLLAFIADYSLGREEDGPYCDECGGCGYVGCDGVRGFLETHVRGATSCANEDIFIDDIEDYFDIER